MTKTVLAGEASSVVVVARDGRSADKALRESPGGRVPGDRRA